MIGDNFVASPLLLTPGWIATELMAFAAIGMLIVR